MGKKLTESEIRELEKQLSCPHGQKGLDVAKNMNETNMGMILNTIEFLEVKNKHSVLELGHGNCEHLEKILGSAQDIEYHGLEISETMFKEAQLFNSGKQASFQLYDGENLPFNDNFFDRTMSVNSIYFWSDPGKLISEIERTLKPGGFCVLTYVDKDFMEKLPFVGQKFKLFDQNEMEKLVKMSTMEIVGFKHKTEQVKTKAGEQVERRYTMAKMTKG